MIDFKFERNGEVELVEEELQSIMQSLLGKDLGFYDLPLDDGLLEEVEQYVQDVKESYDKVVVLGIGGSALGIKTIRDVLMAPQDRDRLRVIDNVDPDFIYEMTYDLELDRTKFVVITKSGGTTETMSLFMQMKNRCTESGLDWKDKFVFVTDPENGLLRKIGERDKIRCFDVPQNVGGRYSVLSAVGILPAAMVGVKVFELMSGAQWMRDRFMDKSCERNTAYQLAKFQSKFHKDGCNVNVLFPYSNKLMRFGEWYAQLLAESIGKNDGVGLTPVTALGATDQHSQLQLYSGGPDDKMYQFIKVRKFENDKIIGLDKDELLSEKFGFLNDVTFGKLLNNELEGTKESLCELGRPICELSLERIDTATLGALFMLYEGATALLGELMEVDAFNQPGVERSKVLTKEYLTKG
jgi:glucose-6-phosphate isomerase